MFSGKHLRVTYQPELPLAMYKELAAHLSQLEGVSTELIWQDRQEFNYAASQIAGISVICSSQISERSQELAPLILNCYGTYSANSAPIQ